MIRIIDFKLNEFSKLFKGKILYVETITLTTLGTTAKPDEVLAYFRRKLKCKLEPMTEGWYMSTPKAKIFVSVRINDGDKVVIVRNSYRDEPIADAIWRDWIITLKTSVDSKPKQ